MCGPCGGVLAGSVVGIEVPSDSPFFLVVLAVHVPVGLGCAVTGLGAALSPKRYGRHPWLGTAYFRLLCILIVTSTVLAVLRFAEDYYLLVLGAVSLGAAVLGRRAMRRRSGRWVRTHVLGMSASCLTLVTAFYLDNAKNLPLWRDVPHLAFWFLPAAVGAPFVARALARYRHLGDRDRVGRSRAEPSA